MTAFIGRKIIFKWDGVLILGVREKGLSLNGEPIDITSDDDAGLRALLDESAENQLDWALSGVTKSEVLVKAWMDGLVTPSARVKPVTAEYPNGRIIGATCRLNNYNETGNYKDAVTFESALQSTGAITYTPGV